MLSECLYLNTSHSLPILASRSVRSSVSTPVEQAKGGHTDYEAPLADVHATLVKVNIDSYPSRHAYGARKISDFAKEYEQKAFSDIAQATSKHTQAAEQAITSVGSVPASARAVAEYTSQLSESINRSRTINIGIIPDPIITVIPSRIEGDIKPGHCRYKSDIHQGVGADIQFHRGNIEFYKKHEGFIRNWVSVGHYDMHV